MVFNRTYQDDTEFTRLIMRESAVNLTVAALELARDGQPDLDFEPSLRWIRERVGELTRAIARARSESDTLAELVECLAAAHGLHGDDTCYGSADGSYLNRVIETTRGIPITLSVLYMGVARELGIELLGVGAPMHFLTRLDAPEGTLFLDAWSFGRIMSESECRQWIQSVARVPDSELGAALRPVGQRAIIIRMLNNLKTLHGRQEKWNLAWRVQHRLAALQPASYRERRDLALLSLRANRPGEAIPLLKSCLSTCGGDEKEFLEQHLSSAKRDISRWN